MDIEKIVENIQRICREKGTNPTEAGRESGAGPNMVSIMKRRGSFPSIEKMSMLAAYLGVTTSELLGEKTGPAPVAEGVSTPPPEYDLLSPEDRALVDSMIRSLSKKQRSGSVRLHVPPKDKADSETAQGNDDIDREVENFRRRLILERNRGGASSPSNGARDETA